MRTVALEEHFSVPALAMIPAEHLLGRGNPAFAQGAEIMKDGSKYLSELGASRIADMDSAGITVQVLSWSGPGADILPPDESVPWAREENDHLAGFIGERPDRYAGFEHLPMTALQAAADELERCVRALGLKGAMVNGTTDGKFLDDPL